MQGQQRKCNREKLNRKKLNDENSNQHCSDGRAVPSTILNLLNMRQATPKGIGAGERQKSDRRRAD